jgi:hypothetical protein
MLPQLIYEILLVIVGIVFIWEVVLPVLVFPFYLLHLIFKLFKYLLCQSRNL